MVKVVPWVNGSGNITLSYDGQGDGQIVVNTDPNDLTVSRSQVIEVIARDKSKQFTVNQLAKPLTPYVDLGLPSGLLWARGNIIKNGNTYAIGEETDYGCYFSWGNIEGHNADDGYDFGTIISGPYASTPGAQVSADIASNDSAHDAALACLGTPWHLPTKEDFSEFYNYTDREWTTINGINGWKFMKKTDHSIYIFLPAAGRGYGTSIENIGANGYYWSSSWVTDTNAYNLTFTSSFISSQTRALRYRGYSVRAVKSSL